MGRPTFDAFSHVQGWQQVKAYERQLLQFAEHWNFHDLIEALKDAGISWAVEELQHCAEVTAMKRSTLGNEHLRGFSIATWFPLVSEGGSDHCTSDLRIEQESH